MDDENGKANFIAFFPNGKYFCIYWRDVSSVKAKESYKIKENQGLVLYAPFGSQC